MSVSLAIVTCASVSFNTAVQNSCVTLCDRRPEEYIVHSSPLAKCVKKLHWSCYDVNIFLLLAGAEKMFLCHNILERIQTLISSGNHFDTFF